MHQNNIHFKKLFFTLAYKNDLKIPKKLNLNKNSNFYKNILQLQNKKKKTLINYIILIFPYSMIIKDLFGVIYCFF
jgi:hypothetical protein